MKTQRQFRLSHSVLNPCALPVLIMLAIFQPGAAQESFKSSLKITNTQTGVKAGAKITSGSNNTADGYSALMALKTGSFNTAVGASALQKNDGSSNVAVGYQALLRNKTGGFNVAIGDGALRNNVTGKSNIGIGEDGGFYNIGSFNINIGNKGTGENRDGIIRLGTDGTHTDTYIAGKIHGDGSGLIGVTATTLSGTISGSQITPASITGTRLAPDLILGGITTGNFNIPATAGSTTGVISQDGTSLLHTYGSQNTFVGKSAGNFTMTGRDNTATGANALISNTKGSSNSASGAYALSSNTTGYTNSASGAYALNSNTTGTRNTAIGANALFSNTTGYSNSASGAYALYSNTTGSFNSASGDSALSSNTGDYNTASGDSALYSNTTGQQNSASGNRALYSNSTGNHNSAFGLAALFHNTTGSDNSAIGYTALYANTTGSNDTAIGNLADVAAPNLSNATAIGAGAKVNASNKIRLGNESVTVIEGQVAFTFTSDRTKKENFEPVNGADVLRKLGDIEFTSWNYIGQDAKEFRHYGVMAQDFHAAFGEDAVGTIGTPTSVNDGDMAGIMMSAIKQLAIENAALKKELAVENAALKKELAAQQTKDRAIEARLASLETAPASPQATMRISLRK